MIKVISVFIVYQAVTVVWFSVTIYYLEHVQDTSARAHWGNRRTQYRLCFSHHHINCTMSLANLLKGHLKAPLWWPVHQDLQWVTATASVCQGQIARCCGDGRMQRYNFIIWLYLSKHGKQEMITCAKVSGVSASGKKCMQKRFNIISKYLLSKDLLIFGLRDGIKWLNKKVWHMVWAW